jgi:hypothetical protein
MEKYYKYIFAFIGILIVSAAVYYYINKDKHEKIKVSIEKNSLKIDNFELSKRTKDKKGYYLIQSKVAKFSRSMNKVDMDFCTIKFVSDNNTLEFTADECLYIVEKEVKLKNNIKGYYNDIFFKTGENGIFYYDMKKEIGNVSNQVFATQNNNSIKSDKLYIDRKKELIKFIDNVEAKYEIKETPNN